MNQKPVYISISILAVVTLVAIWIWQTNSICLSDSELVNSSISLFAMGGALISATLVIYSYMQTNQAFVEGKRPQLLIQVKSDKAKKNHESNELIPIAFIHYNNVTGNQFRDLTINVKVFAQEKEYDISDLFQPNMTMPGHDSRQRMFSPVEVLAEKGLNINALANEGHDVTLKISYKHTFLGKSVDVDCQEYKWDPNIEHWIIK